MTWGSYYFFYDCPECGKKYRWEISDMDEDIFSQCPCCHTVGIMAGESRDIRQGDGSFDDYEYIF